MKTFIDSAIISEIKQAYQWKLVGGITTNPSLMKKAVDAGAATNLKEYLVRILGIAGTTPVSLEVTSRTLEGMIRQGRAIYRVFKPFGNVYVKIPINPAFKPSDKNQLDGIKAIETLSKEGVPINCTLIFTPEQALLAAKAGASFVSPFAGRIDDYLRERAKLSFKKDDYYPAHGAIVHRKVLADKDIVSGIHLVALCVQAMRRYGYKTKVLAASLRNTLQIAEAQAVDADIATVPFSAMMAMKQNPALIPHLSLPSLSIERWKKMDSASKGKISPALLLRLLQHPKTFEGMKTFTADIVPEYATLLEE